MKRDSARQPGTWSTWKSTRTARSTGEILALAALLLSVGAAVLLPDVVDLAMPFGEQAALLFIRPDGRLNVVTALTVGLTLACALGLVLALRAREETRVRAELLAQEVTGSRSAVERLTSTLAARDQQLLSVIHELRAPLTYVVGYAELLSRGQRPHAAHEVAEMSTAIQAASATMVRLMDDLAQATHLQAPGFTLKTQSVELAPMIRGIVAGYGVHSATHRFTLQAPDEHYTVTADPERLQQVLANLLTNAVTYSPAGSEVLVRARLLGDYVRVEISDHGIGMAPEDQQRAFDRFYRGGAARTLRADGSGLGLAIVRDLVEAHGGHVGVVSRVGQGSTFWFTLPTADGYAPAREVTRPAPQQASAI